MLIWMDAVLENGMAIRQWLMTQSGCGVDRCEYAQYVDIFHSPLLAMGLRKCEHSVALITASTHQKNCNGKRVRWNKHRYFLVIAFDGFDTDLNTKKITHRTVITNTTTTIMATTKTAMRYYPSAFPLDIHDFPMLYSLLQDASQVEPRIVGFPPSTSQPNPKHTVEPNAIVLLAANHHAVDCKGIHAVHFAVHLPICERFTTQLRNVRKLGQLRSTAGENLAHRTVTLVDYSVVNGVDDAYAEGRIIGQTIHQLLACVHTA